MAKRDGGATIGLADVVARGDLGRARAGSSPRRFVPSAFDVNLLRVVERAITTTIPTALVLPAPGEATSALVASATLVANVVSTNALNTRIALVTKQTHLRAFYTTLYCGRERLSAYIPAALILPTGATSDIGYGNKYGNQRQATTAVAPGRLYFTPDLERLGALESLESLDALQRPQERRHEMRLDGVVIEARATDGASIERLLARRAGQIPILYLTSDPDDPVLPLFERDGAIWAWNPSALSVLLAVGANPAARSDSHSDAICASPSTLEAAANAGYHIVSPDAATEADIALARLWDDLTIIQRHPGGPGFETVRWVWGVFNALSQLIVPVADYDRYARAAWGATALGDAPAKARAFAKHAPRYEDGEYWSILSADLEDTLTALRRSNPKPAALAEWVARRVEAQERGVVVTRNRPARQAVEAYLQARPDVPLGWARTIQLVTFAELGAGRVTSETSATNSTNSTSAALAPWSAIVFPGPISARDAGLLALPVAPAVTILGQGPWEAGRAARQVRSIVASINALACGPTRERAVARLFPDGDPGPVCQPLAPQIDYTSVENTRIPATARDATWDPFSVTIMGQGVDHARFRAASDMEGPADDSPHGVLAEVEALRIVFTDGVGYFEPQTLVARLDGEDLRDVAAKALRPGDRILLVEGGAKKDLFDAIVEQLEELPEFEATALLVQEWQERVRRGYFALGAPYHELLARMDGASVATPATIGHWIRGTVHGPADPEDIRRLGLALGDAFLAERWRQIGQALATMRAHRRKVGRMLASALLQATVASESWKAQETQEAMDRTDGGGYFDRRLGIHLSDLTAAVSVHLVVSVGAQAARVPYALVNRLLGPQEAQLIAVS